MELIKKETQHKNKAKNKIFLFELQARLKRLITTNKTRLLFLAILIFIIPLLFAKAAGSPDPVITVSFSPNNPIVNQQVTVTVKVSNIIFASTNLEIDFDDGITSPTAGCPQSTATNPSCERSFKHTYTTTGPKTIKVSFWPPNTDRTFNIVVLSNTGHGTGASSGNGMNPLNYNTFGELFDRILTVIFYISIIFLPLLIVVGLFLMLSSSATPEKIALGRKIILYSVVILGIIIMIRSMFAYFKGGLTFI